MVLIPMEGTEGGSRETEYIWEHTYMYIYFRGNVKIPSFYPQTFHKMLQNHLRGSVT